MKRFTWIVVMIAALLAAGPGRAEPAEDAPASETYIPHELGPSLLEKANTILTSGDPSGAIPVYEQWLAADPRDNMGWYNYACALALNKQPGDAVVALEKAVDSGWKDIDHTLQDPDLESLRDLDRFKAILERMRHQAQAEVIPGSRRQYLNMTSLWTYLVILPPDYETGDRSYPLCLILHGSGSTEVRHGAIAMDLGREDVIYVCPRAAYPHPDVFAAGRHGYTAWFPEPLDDPELGRRLETGYVDWIFDCVADARSKYRIDSGRLFIVGHSQGAGTANLCALLRPHDVASYFSFAGYLVDQGNDAALFRRMKQAGVKPYLCHCKNDPLVPIAASEEIVARLKEAGIDCKFYSPDGDHGFNPEVIALMKQWVDTEIRRPPVLD